MIQLVVYALAVARVTRLVTRDRITARPRSWLIERAWLADCSYCHAGTPQERRNNLRLHRSAADKPMMVDLITCPWCISIWLAIVAVPLVKFWGASSWLFWPAVGLAFSYVTGLLAKLEG